MQVTTSGNLITMAENGQFDIIVQGCNCHNTMGRGIAKEIRERYPEAYASDCRTIKSDPKKLGTFSAANVTAHNGNKFTIINAYTQYNYSGNKLHADYAAIRKAFNLIARTYPVTSRIAYPLIGAGLAGGDWAIISSIIREELDPLGFEHTLVNFDGSK